MNIQLRILDARNRLRHRCGRRYSESGSESETYLSLRRVAGGVVQGGGPLDSARDAVYASWTSELRSWPLTFSCPGWAGQLPVLPIVLLQPMLGALGDGRCRRFRTLDGLRAQQRWRMKQPGPREPPEGCLRGDSAATVRLRSSRPGRSAAGEGQARRPSAPGRGDVSRVQAGVCRANSARRTAPGPVRALGFRVNAAIVDKDNTASVYKDGCAMSFTSWSGCHWSPRIRPTGTAPSQPSPPSAHNSALPTCIVSPVIEGGGLRAFAGRPPRPPLAFLGGVLCR